MKKMTISVLFFLGLSLTAYCGTTSSIKLTDGSVIEAEIVSFENGIYTLNTPSLGTIKIAASKIQNIQISTGGAAAQGKPQNIPTSLQSDVERLKSKITSDPAAMKTVTALMSDAQFQELMQDPEIMNAAKAGDAQALMSNPKFMSLTNNPKIREIAEKLNAETK